MHHEICSVTLDHEMYDEHIIQAETTENPLQGLPGQDIKRPLGRSDVDAEVKRKKTKPSRQMWAFDVEETDFLFKNELGLLGTLVEAGGGGEVRYHHHYILRSKKDTTYLTDLQVSMGQNTSSLFKGTCVRCFIKVTRVSPMW